MFSETEILGMVRQATDLAFKKFREKEYEQAEVIVRQALKVHPEDPNGLQILGLVLHNKGQFEEAIENFEKAISLEPDNAETYNNLALCYSNTGKIDKAIDLLHNAIDLKPGCSYMFSNLGLQYRQKGDTEKAIYNFRRSLALSEEATTWGMLGGCYGELQDLDGAEECFKKALAIDPDFAGAHVDLASIYQMRGQWEEAWPEYEWRYKVYDQLKFWLRIYEPEKKWTGQPLQGKRIIVHGEQGHGDAIHFFRYVKYLEGAHVIVHCAPQLAPLFENQVDEVYTTDPSQIPVYEYRQPDYPMPAYDYHCSLLSLPYVLKNPPIPPAPYIFTSGSVDMSDYKNCLKVGICWCGNPQHPNDANRSVRLTRFREIHDIPGVKLFSLVTDTRPRAYRFMPAPVDLTEGADDMRIVDMAPHIQTFGDTAAIIQSLDLVITVDTAVMHLCGAVGLPCWGLIPWNTDWRWGLKGDTTVWYPSLRLFRQPTMGDWDSVFARIHKELRR
jgi:tetratricopeptide (TPR) repeat protein